jgi:hypothetical protein
MNLDSMENLSGIVASAKRDTHRERAFLLNGSTFIRSM